jgi:hypothetical protein
VSQGETHQGFVVKLLCGEFLHGDGLAVEFSLEDGTERTRAQRRARVLDEQRVDFPSLQSSRHTASAVHRPEPMVAPKKKLSNG